MATARKKAATKKKATKKKVTKKKVIPITPAQKKAAAAKEAENKARKKAKRLAKEAFVSEVQRSLEKTAQQINHRLASIDRKEKQTDDMRLAAAILIAEAKERCREIRQKFPDWCETHLHFPPKEPGGEPRKLSYETVRKLAPIGQAERDQEGAGLKLLEDMREKNKEANQAARARAGASSTEPPSKEKVRQVLDKMEAEEREELLLQQAKMYELPVGEAAEEEESTKLTAIERAEAAFGRLRARDKLVFVNWVCAEVGGSFVMDDEEEHAEFPDDDDEEDLDDAAD